MRASVELGDGRQQRARIGMTRVGEELGGGRVLDDPAAIDDIDAVGELSHHAEIMRNEQDRGSAAPDQIVHQMERARLNRDVEAAAGLVGDRRSGSLTSASAIITRWLMPPDS